MDLPLANYAAEQQEFQELIQPDSRQRILMLRGESGAGKTRLLEHFLESAPPAMPALSVQLRGRDTTVAAVFNRLGRRVGWERFPAFIRQVGSMSGADINGTGTIPAAEMQARLRSLMNVADSDRRRQQKVLLTDAWFVDLERFEGPLLLALDTFEQATTELERWVTRQVLPWVADTTRMRVLIAGQDIPDPSSDWQHCCSYHELRGVRAAEEWLPVARALGREVPSLDFLAGACAMAAGNPSQVLEFIQLLPAAPAPTQPQLTLVEQRSAWRQHLLVARPEEGVRQMRRTALEWQNFPHFAYDAVESLARSAREHAEAGRLGAGGRGWAAFWEAHLALLYGRSDEALALLSSIPEGEDPVLTAEKKRAEGDIHARAGRLNEAFQAYSAAAAAFEAGGQPLSAALLTAEIEAAGGEVASAEPKPQPPETPAAAQAAAADRSLLIENIHAVWIDGVLRQSLTYEIALDMTPDSGQVSQAGGLVWHASGHLDRSLPRGLSPARLFDLTRRSLLILGAPGSGKTTTLLRLLEQLLQAARERSDSPLPLLFNLSSWRARKGDLGRWLVDEAGTQYRLSKRFARELLETRQVILLLDGLDEVPLEERDGCVEAINHYLAANPGEMVVCSRTGDYQALENRLRLSEAIVLQPLTTEQIDAYLAAGGEAWQPLRETILQDSSLLELVRTPLMLNVLVLIGRTLTREELDPLQTLESVRRFVFDRYVEEMLARRPVEQDGYTPAQVRRWLANLAAIMQTTGQTIFFIEDLQPDILSPRQHPLYRLMTGFLAGAIGGMGFAGILGILNLFIDRLGIGLLVLIVASLTGAAITWATTKLKNAVARLVLGMMFTALLLSAVSYPLIPDPQVTGITPLLGLIFSLGASFSLGLAAGTVEIALRERLPQFRPNSTRFMQGVWQGGLIGAGLAFLIGLVSVLPRTTLEGFDNPVFIIFLFTAFPCLGSILFGLLGGLFFQFDFPPVDRRILPGQGVGRSLRNSLILSSTIGLVLALSGVLGILTNTAIGFLLLLLLLFLPFLFLLFGGLAFFQHLIVRILLARSDTLPYRLPHFLEAAARRVLLRQAGGGYIFMHRSLLEYFAAA